MFRGLLSSPSSGCWCRVSRLPRCRYTTEDSPGWSSAKRWRQFPKRRAPSGLWGVKVSNRIPTFATQSTEPTDFVKRNMLQRCNRHELLMQGFEYRKETRSELCPSWCNPRFNVLFFSLVPYPPPALPLRRSHRIFWMRAHWRSTSSWQYL
jgi:hypothetical protein